MENSKQKSSSKKSCLIFLLSVVFFAGCRTKDTSSEEGLIMIKSYRTEFGNQMPNCICRYMTRQGGDLITFEDSCAKYSVGDTIAGFKSKKHY